MRVDDYSVDKKGNIKLEQLTKDKIDKLYVKNDNGTLDKNKSIEVEKGILSKGQHQEITRPDPMNTGTDITTVRDYYEMPSNSKSSELFEFLSDNTKVEWNLGTFSKNGAEVMNLLITTHHESWVGSSNLIDWYIDSKGYSLIRDDHNHPSGNATPSGKEGDMGFAAKYPKATFRIYTSNDKRYSTYSLPK